METNSTVRVLNFLGNIVREGKLPDRRLPAVLSQFVRSPNVEVSKAAVGVLRDYSKLPSHEMTLHELALEEKIKLLGTLVRETAPYAIQAEAGLSQEEIEKLKNDRCEAMLKLASLAGENNRLAMELKRAEEELDNKIGKIDDTAALSSRIKELERTLEDQSRQALADDKENSLEKLEGEKIRQQLANELNQLKETLEEKEERIELLENSDGPQKERISRLSEEIKILRVRINAMEEEKAAVATAIRQSEIEHLDREQKAREIENSEELAQLQKEVLALKACAGLSGRVDELQEKIKILLKENDALQVRLELAQSRHARQDQSFLEEKKNYEDNAHKAEFILREEMKKKQLAHEKELHALRNELDEVKNVLNEIRKKAKELFGDRGIGNLSIDAVFARILSDQQALAAVRAERKKAVEEKERALKAAKKMEGTIGRSLEIVQHFFKITEKPSDLEEGVKWLHAKYLSQLVTADKMEKKLAAMKEEIDRLSLKLASTEEMMLQELIEKLGWGDDLAKSAKNLDELAEYLRRLLSNTRVNEIIEQIKIDQFPVIIEDQGEAVCEIENAEYKIRRTPEGVVIFKNLEDKNRTRQKWKFMAFLVDDESFRIDVNQREFFVITNVEGKIKIEKMDKDEPFEAETAFGGDDLTGPQTRVKNPALKNALR